MLKYAVGLDISCKKIDCCFSVIDTEQKVKVLSSKVINNTVKGFKELVDWLNRNQKDQTIKLVVGMEVTGVYYERCAYYLYERGFNVVVVLANYAKKYFDSCGQKSKNDKKDSQTLARMLAERNHELWQPAEEFYEELANLTRYHDALQETLTVHRNQLHAEENSHFSSKYVLNNLKKLIKQLEKQEQEVVQQIQKHIESNQEVNRKVKQIVEPLKGVGIMTIAKILAETKGFHQFKNSRQLVSYSGLDIVENQSGNRVGKTRISKKGNVRIRKALYFPSLSLIQHQVKPFKDLFDRTFEKHHIKMKSYVAVQKKLLVIIFSLWKKDVAFSENYLDTIKNQTVELEIA